MKTLRLLVLSAGSLSAQNIIDALGARRTHCVVIGANSAADAAGAYRCDTVYRVPPAAHGAEYLEAIRTLVATERPDLVIPSRDDDVLALARLAEMRVTGKTAVLAGTVATARVMNDKAETARFAARHGLPFAATATTAAQALELVQTCGLPLIGKPRSGNASVGVVLLRSAAEIERAFALRPELIVQAFIDPPPDMQALIAPFDAGMPFFFSFPTTHRSTQTIVGPDAEVSATFATLNTQVAGQDTQITRLDDPEVLRIGRAYALAAAAEGWRGPVNVQLKCSPDHRLLAFELNGRCGGGTAARALLGFDEIGEIVRRFLNIDDFPPLPPAQCVSVQKYLTSYPVPSNGPATLRDNGRWAG